MKMIRNNRILLFVLLILPPFAFSSCESEPAQVKVRLEGDYRGLLEAIRSTDQSLSDKLALVEGAVNSGLASNQQAIQLLQEMIKALEGSSLEKLLAIEGAIKSQTTGLETKLALVEAAVQSGFADTAKAQALMAQALDATCKTLEEKLAAISGKLTTEQLPQAFKGVADAIEGKIQSEGELLKAMQDMVSGLQQVLPPTA